MAFYFTFRLNCGINTCFDQQHLTLSKPLNTRTNSFKCNMTASLLIWSGRRKLQFSRKTFSLGITLMNIQSSMMYKRREGKTNTVF